MISQPPKTVLLGISSGEKLPDKIWGYWKAGILGMVLQLKVWPFFREELDHLCAPSIISMVFKEIAIYAYRQKSLYIVSGKTSNTMGHSRKENSGTISILITDCFP